MEEEATRSRILKAAMEEFMRAGFSGASLRKISREAGVTTGAFYGYFKSKEEVFDALVGEAADHILSMYRNILTDFQSLPPEEQQTDMMAHTLEGVKDMTDYIYGHLPAFQLILKSSQGTKYDHFVSDLARMDMDATHDFARSMEGMGLAMETVNPMLEHMLISGMFSSYFELVIHGIPREEADHYIKQLLIFNAAGWQALMGF